MSLIKIRKYGMFVILMMILMFTGCAWLATHSPTITPAQTAAAASVVGTAAGAAAGAAATAGASSSPVTAPFASQIGSLALGLVGGLATHLVMFLGNAYNTWQKKYGVPATTTPTTPAA
jgi:zona occludens toxin (predicted ATPase)